MKSARYGVPWHTVLDDNKLKLFLKLGFHALLDNNPELNPLGEVDV